MILVKLISVIFTLVLKAIFQQMNVFFCLLFKKCINKTIIEFDFRMIS